MPKPSPYPHHPVRVLRTLLGFPSADAFAKFTGVPAETIRNLEQGRRSVTSRVAKQIGIATGVFHGWLQTGNVARGKPINECGERLTKEEFENFAGIGSRRALDPNKGKLADKIEEYCFWATQLLRGAARRGRFAPCRYFLRMALRDAQAQFHLKKEADAEGMPELYSGSDWADYRKVCRLLSPTTQFRWNAALSENDQTKITELAAELDDLRAMLQRSSARCVKRRPPSKRSSPRRRIQRRA
jgi:hypothetical protein